MQKMIDFLSTKRQANPPSYDVQIHSIIMTLSIHVITLVKDLNGNHVVQKCWNRLIPEDNQKFSSNVIEKLAVYLCGGHHTRKMSIEELLYRNCLEKLLRDSFGNYCVQTASDYAEPTQRMLLVEGIRPTLLLIRNTPYGKPIKSGLQHGELESHHQQYGNRGFNEHAAVAGLAAMNENGTSTGNRHV
ncbi:Pumilio-family RNA binding repeat [Ceratobasidium sp. AG-Ba]|nr:Pumilio-family RNA binding repeat [Ceratobasidium sp. AG-Ba]